MKKNNPYTPIMLREAQGTEPRVFARYGMSFPPGKKKTSAFLTIMNGRTDPFFIDRAWQGEAGVAGWCVFVSVTFWGGLERWARERG